MWSARLDSPSSVSEASDRSVSWSSNPGYSIRDARGGFEDGGLWCPQWDMAAKEHEVWSVGIASWEILRNWG